MPRLVAAVVLAVPLSTLLASGLRADSTQAGLRVGVEVTRQCAVTTGTTVDVRCTRSAGAAVQTTVDGNALTSPTPLTVSGPGVVGASIPLATGASGTRVVTVLF